MPKKKSNAKSKIIDQLMPKARRRASAPRPPANLIATEECDPCALNAYHRLSMFNLGAAFGTSVTLNLPQGFRFVIEVISAVISVPAGGKALLTVSGQTSNNPLASNFFIPLTPQGVFGGDDVFVATQAIRLYTDDKIDISVGRDNDTGASVVVCLSGYLLKL